MSWIHSWLFLGARMDAIIKFTYKQQHQAAMHFSHLALVFLPFAFGHLHHDVPRGLRHHGKAKDIKGMPPHGDTPAARAAFGHARRHGGGPPGNHRRVKQTKTTPPPDDTTAAPQETITPRFQCGDENPLSILEAECPCFNLETITGIADLGTAEYCDYYAEDDPSFLFQYAGFSASFPATGGQSTYISFSTSNDAEPGFEGRYCDGTVDFFTGDETIGEDHAFFVSVELTEAEYDACKNTLSTLRDQLPATCNMN